MKNHKLQTDYKFSASARGRCASGVKGGSASGGKKDVNVVNQTTGEGWVYSDTVKKHFFYPKNLLLKDPKPGDFDAEGTAGSPACGDMMRMWLKIDSKTRRIKKLKWRTFGCASAIASTSMFSEMVVEKGGMTVNEALKIRPQDILKRLGGLPERKIHCSVLADQAFRKTVDNYFRGVQKTAADNMLK